MSHRVSSSSTLICSKHPQAITLRASASAIRQHMPTDLSTQMQPVLTNNRHVFHPVSPAPVESVSRVTCSTLPIRHEIAEDQRMTAMTSMPLQGATSILFERNRLKMIRKHTRSHCTKMINSQINGNAAYEHLISNPMCRYFPPRQRESSISCVVLPSQPQPAVTTRVHLDPEPRSILSTQPIRPDDIVEPFKHPHTSARHALMRAIA